MTDPGHPTAGPAPADLIDPASGITLLDWQAAEGDHQYTVSARHDGGDRIMLLIHAVRQAALLIAHEAFDVPRSHHCVFQALSCSAPAVGGDGQLEGGTPLTLSVRLIDPDMRRGQLVSSTFAAAITVEGKQLGTARVTFTFLSPAAYRFVRGSGEAAGDSQAWPEATTVEMTASEEQLEFRGQPVDHIPGMVMVNSALALARSHGNVQRIQGIDGRFTGYTDPHLPCTFQLRPAGDACVDVQALQDSRCVYEGSVEVSI
ncbi:AfsA-related hotdog domain-containing protein [Streptomyces sp. NPDC057694]|uniref:AfsA-related hotdog domain-containing protein n=1 Tax=unclassified Streptomyces TaxID=2593676 RepID=UPI0036C15066